MAYSFTANLHDGQILGPWQIGFAAYGVNVQMDATIDMLPSRGVTHPAFWAAFDVAAGSNLTINGTFGDQGTKLVGGDMTVNGSIGGGLLTMDGAYNPHNIKHPYIGTLTLNGAAGPDETIKIDVGHLVLGDVKDFHSTVDMVGAGNVYQDVLFEGIHATTCNYDVAHGMLELTNSRGCQIAAAHIKLGGKFDYASPLGWHVSDTAAGDKLSYGSLPWGGVALGHNQ
jgi:hypothetical protein